MYFIALGLIVLVLLTLCVIDTKKSMIIKYLYKKCVGEKVYPAFVVPYIDEESCEIPIRVERIHVIKH